MQESQDTELLRQYVRENSDEAFAALVSRYVNMVYSAALRKTGNPVAAEEVTQTVFVILAKKANGLLRHAALSGWLYQAARLTAANFLRTEIRRTRREQEAYMQSLSKQTEPEIWPQIMPLLEDAMGRLGEKDRNALALRFFEGKSFREIGATFGVSENAARKRTNYALEKLRTYFSQCGVTSTIATIAGVISANSVQAAPVGLAEVATAVALAKGATASASTLTLIKGALKIMAWSKAKTAIVVGIGILLAVGIGTTTTALMVQHQQSVQMLTNFPRSSWENAGYADPTSALKTIFWAQTQGDGKTYLASMTPELQQQLQQQFAGDLAKQGLSLEEFFTQKSKGHIAPVTGFYIWGQKTVSNQLLLRVWIPGKGKSATFKMRKIGSEWKLDEEFFPDY